MPKKSKGLQNRHPRDVHPIKWTKAMQFLALDEGWAIVREPGTQIASLVAFNDYKHHFKTNHDAFAHVIRKASTNNNQLYATAIAFLDQQIEHQWNGSWEKPIHNQKTLHLFYNKERDMRNARRSAARPYTKLRHEQLRQAALNVAPEGLPILIWTLRDQQAAIMEGWCLHASYTHHRVMPRRTESLSPFADDMEAEEWVGFRSGLDTIHTKAIEFRDRWLADPHIEVNRCCFGPYAIQAARRALGRLL